MDRRLLLYFAVLIATFFFIHEWLSPPVKPASQSAVTIQIDPTLHPSSELTIGEEKLYGLVKLYSDIEQTQFLSYAVQQGLSCITLSWEEKLPDQVFARFDASPYGNVNRLQPLITSKELYKPVLFGVYPNDMLRLPHTPELGRYPIRLVSLSDANKKAEVLYGEVVDGKVTKLSAMPTHSALALYENENEFFPFGLFDPQTKKLVKFIDLPDFATRANVVLPENQISSIETKEAYYVLQNDYQQLVFTTKSGALAEINLPFHSETNPLSVVREIDIDRILKAQYPLNATFPQYPYYAIANNGQSEMLQPMLGGYYPLLRRNIMGLGGRPSQQVPPHTYAFSLISSENASEVFQYRLKRHEKDLIEFELVQGNRKITKTFSFPANPAEAPYCFDVAIKIEGDARGLLVCPGIPEAELISDSFTPTLKYQISRNQKQVVESISPPKKLVTYSHVQPNWVCNGNGFFGLVVNPLTPPAPGLNVIPLSGTLVPSRLTVIDADYDRFPPAKYPAYEMHLPLSLNPAMTKFRVFAGPFDKTVLTTIDQTYTDPQTGQSPNFIACQSFQGWFAFISEPFAKFLFLLMNAFHSFTHSWGISILLLTIALRVMLYPLNQWSIKSTLKMQLVSPKVAAIQEKYKKDPKQAQAQIMNLYRQEGVNPFSGCLPLLIQMPFLIGMFDLLKSSFDLRGAVFIPGWIDNLTAPDIVFSWSYPLLFFGNSFHLLPILLGVVMYFQQRYTSSSTTAAGAKLTDQQKQQRLMGNIMVIVFSVMFYHFPSGLNLYWLFSMLLGILQQWWTTKNMAPVKKS